jgi:glycosyltransferase involved in cell wall biosynthesis
MVAYSVIIPCYRSGPWLEALVDRVVSVMDAQGAPFEILLINDASPDDTWAAIERIAGRNPCVRGIDLLFNAGQFRAIICGLEHARGQFVITMDDDGQHPPEEIPVLIKALRSRPDLDCVFGAYRQKQHGPIRNLGTLLREHLHEWLYGKPRNLQTTSFRILRREVAMAVCAHRTARPVIGPLILKSTRRIADVEVEHRPREAGASGYRLAHLLRIYVDNVIGASTLPLKCISTLGMLFATVSLVFGIIYLAGYLTGRILVPGFTTLVLLINFFGGMTLLSIGLLGEYVIRIISEVTRPPRYIIRNATNEPRANEDLHPDPPATSRMDGARSLGSGSEILRCVSVETGAPAPRSGGSGPQRP